LYLCSIKLACFSVPYIPNWTWN